MTVRPRSLALAAVLAASLTASPALAAPARAWTVLETPHFRVHYYPGEEQTARRVAAAAETNLPRLEQDFGVSLKDRVPIILSRDNFFNGSAEPLKQRIQLDPVLAASSEIGTERFVTHELAHVLTFLALQNETPLSRLQNLGGVPTWFLEGIAQYTAEYWYASSDEMLRLGTLQHGLLTATQRDHFGLLGVEGGAAGYNEGFALTRYLFDTHGRQKLPELLGVLRKGEVGSFNKAVEQVFGKSLALLQADWLAATKAHYATQTQGVAEHLADSRAIVPSAVREVNVRPRLSPDGKRLAFLTSRHQDGYLYLRGHVMGGLTLAVADPQGQQVQELKVGQGRVASYDWSPDGQQLVVSVIDRDAAGEPGFNLFLHDLDKRTTTALTTDGSATHPAWRPGTRQIAYVATQDGTSRLMIHDLERKASRPWEQLELGDRHARDLAWSPDGRTLALAVYAPGEGARLATLEAGSPRLREWTNPTARQSDRAPAWTPDGKALVFMSDRDGMTNLYRLALGASPRLEQLSKVYAGAHEPAMAPDGQLYYAAARAMGRELRVAPLPAGEPLTYQSPAPRLALATGSAEPAWSTRPYAPTMTSDLVMPQVTSDERGSQLGVMALYSDILDQQQLGLDVRYGLLSQRFSYAASYLNRMAQVPWGVTLFDTPTMGITRELDPARLYDAIYWQRSQGVNLGMQHRMGSQTVALSFALANLGVLQGPTNHGTVRTGRQQTLTLGWSDMRLARTSDADLNPSDGYFLGAGLTVSDRLLGSDFGYAQLQLQGARYLNVHRDWRHNLGWTFQFALNHGDAFPLFLGGIQGGGPLVPLRGYNVGSFAGDRLFMTGLEYTFPLFRGLDMQLGPLYLHQLYGAAFVEAGDAWTAARPMQLHPTSGFELRLKTAFMSRQQVVFRVGVSRKLTADGNWGMYLSF